MPKLKLDIFGESPSQTENPKSPPEQPIQDRLEETHPLTTSALVEKGESRERPQFIPVGFYEEHLRILDEAVLKQRRQGNWKASKSAIIRRLIDHYKKDLHEFE